MVQSSPRKGLTNIKLEHKTKTRDDKQTLPLGAHVDGE